MKRTLSVTMLIALSLFAAETAQIDSLAPNFTLKDHTGKSHSLEKYRGSIVVLEWVNLDCPFVKKHYDTKNMQGLQKQYGEKKVVWLSICSSAKGKQGHFDRKTIAKRLKDHGASQKAYLIDADGKVGKMYGARTTPHLFIVNQEGILSYAGAIDDKASTNKDDVEGAKNYVKASLDALLAGTSPETKVTNPYGCSIKY